MNIYDELYEFSREKAKHTVWVFSDLQQGYFPDMKKCLDTCINDYKALGSPAEAIWYLGDAVEGIDEENIEKMITYQEKAFEELGIPLTYANGNHDFDFVRHSMENKTDAPFKVPFYDMVRMHPDWHVAPSVELPYFTVDFHDFKLFVFQDHVSLDKKWLSTHNQIMLGEESYPYKKDYFDKIRSEMESFNGPIITMGHTAFPGGNREEEIRLTNQVQPLPLNVKLHLYGHSHIGEYRCPGKRVFSQIQWVDWQDIPQVDVASFENIRGNYCHSVLLHIYEDNSLGLFFRNHDKARFESAFFPAKESHEKNGDYAKNVKPPSDK